MASNRKEKTITCPYNVSHQIRPERIQYHLVKCREQNPKVDLVICPYNATHHVPRPEEQYHISTCADRKIVEMAKYSWLYDKPGQQGNLTNPIPNSANIPVEEDQQTTDENDNQQGVKGSGDPFGSLRRPAVVSRETTKVAAVHPFLQENTKVAAVHPFLQENTKVAAVHPFLQENTRPEKVATEASHTLMQENNRPEKVAVDGHAPLRRPGQLAVAGRSKQETEEIAHF